MTATERKTGLEAKLSKIAGFAVEITVRGDKSFTLSAEGSRDLSKAVKFLSLSGRVENLTSTFDDECDMTFCWFDVV